MYIVWRKDGVVRKQRMKVYALFYNDQFNTPCLISGGHWAPIDPKTALAIAEVLSHDSGA